MTNEYKDKDPLEAGLAQLDGYQNRLRSCAAWSAAILGCAGIARRGGF